MLLGCVNIGSILLSSRDGYLLEPTKWPKGSQASCGVWRDLSRAGDDGNGAGGGTRSGCPERRLREVRWTEAVTEGPGVATAAGNAPGARQGRG